MKKFFIFALLAVVYASQAQQVPQVQWAFKVLDYSSQKGTREFSAQQVLGKPNVLPSSGESKNAWQPKDDPKKEESIKVGFQNPINAKQILVGESHNPGFISKIYAYDAKGKEYEVATYKPELAKVTGRLFSTHSTNLDFTVFAVKIVFRPQKEKPIGIDAIGITESTQPVELKMNQSDMLKANMVLTKLEKTVNSVYPEFGPLLSPDGKILYFSRRYDPKNMGGKEDVEDIWYAEWNPETNHWKEAKNMGIPLNSKDPNFINSVSPDGNTILLGNSYYKDGSMEDGVSVSHRTAKGWSFPERLKIEDDENVNDKANFYLSNSKRVLLMSVERKGDTKGDRDIYVSFPKEDSTWTKPMNLGSVINTIGTEAAPYLAADERTLYFTSDGFSGYGGSDIYISHRLDDTWKKWSEPENLGPIINTAYDESYFTLSASGDKVYFTSAGEKPGDQDMYTLSLPDLMKPAAVAFVKGRVFDSKTKEPISGVNIYFENLSSGVLVGIAQSHPATADYGITLPSGAKYGFLAHKPGYISVSANLDLENLGKYIEMNKDLYLTPLETGQSIVLNNIFFDTDKSELKKESFPELNRLVKVLKASPSMKVEISGHTDSKGSEAHNDVLSQQRAKAVATYLLQKSEIDDKRVMLRYYGESKPKADNTTAEGRQENRRVEFMVMSK